MTVAIIPMNHIADTASIVPLINSSVLMVCVYRMSGSAMETMTASIDPMNLMPPNERKCYYLR